MSLTTLPVNESGVAHMRVVYSSMKSALARVAAINASQICVHAQPVRALLDAHRKTTVHAQLYASLESEFAAIR